MREIKCACSMYLCLASLWSSCPYSRGRWRREKKVVDQVCAKDQINHGFPELALRVLGAELEDVAAFLVPDDVGGYSGFHILLHVGIVVRQGEVV